MHMRPTDSIGGYTQFINLPIPTSAILTDKIYIGLFNYDLPSKISAK